MRIFEPKYINKRLKEGAILLSEPLLLDKNFSRTVVLICEHNDKGTVGLVLNRLTSSKLSDIIEGFESIDLPIYDGGPVEHDILQFIHTLGEEVPDSLHIGDGVYWGGDLNYIRNMAESGSLDKEKICFFVGYAGWGACQLDDEIAEKSWFVSNISVSSMFQVAPEERWEYCVRNLGESFRIWLNCPTDPILN